MAGRMPQGWLAVDLTMATRWVDATGAERPVDFDQARRFALDLLAHAAGIILLDIVYLHKNGQSVLSAAPLAAFGETELSDAVRARYQDALVKAGLQPPDRWSPGAVARLQHEHRQRVPGSSSTGDLLDALHVAAEAKPVLARLDGHDIGGRKLQALYHRHVGGGWPEVIGGDELLVLAASTGIAERRGLGAQEPLMPLARFMLGVAGYRRAPVGASLDDPELKFLADWITGSLELNRADADAYLASEIGGQTWAIIELEDDDSTEPTWPDRLVVGSIDDHGRPGESFNVACAEKSAVGLRDALRTAITRVGGGDGNLCVDLLMPAHLLTAGVEHYEVVDVDGTYEPMIKDLEPRLGWRRHRYEGVLRKRLTKRFALQDWALAAEVIPRDIRGDQDRFKSWLQSCEARSGYPPYFSGIAPADNGYDPLRALLREGYGFFAWFCHGTAETVTEHAVSLANPVNPAMRRNALPDILSRGLASHRAAIIWSDPGGRPDFPVPPAPRRGGQNRRGGQ